MLTEDIFYTIAGISEGLYKEKGSKFISFCIPVNSEIEANSVLQDYRDQYYDARHVCYAFILGLKGEILRSSDDGEPAHTAGDPILNQLKSAEITNVMAVIIRYFGGTRLGKSGLIQAYKTATKDALSNSKRIKKHIKTTLHIDFEYSDVDTVMRLTESDDVEIEDQQYGNSCSMEVKIRASQEDHFTSLFNPYSTIRIKNVQNES